MLTSDSQRFIFLYLLSRGPRGGLTGHQLTHIQRGRRWNSTGGTAMMPRKEGVNLQAERRQAPTDRHKI
ncbi:hypothetical protein LEMLEM_LOCUS9096 [Lemmus lemmus]